MNGIRIAVIGAGYLGRFHAQKYAALEETELVAVVDIDKEQAERVAEECGSTPYTDYRQVLDEIDAASIVVPTSLHYQVAKDLLEAGKHILLEKPMTVTLEEADELIALADGKGLVLQVGHLERFNPAIVTLEREVSAPLFIEAHRLSGFKLRATDVDVVLDLMIHDIDIILSLVNSEVREIRAAGVPVLTPRVDIANVRLIFENGCTANLTASRISLKDLRRIRVFQQGAYIAADCTERNNLIVRGQDALSNPFSIRPNFIKHEESDNLMEEIKDFVAALQGKKAPKVDGRAGRRALDLASRINRAILDGLESAGIKGVL